MELTGYTAAWSETAWHAAAGGGALGAAAAGFCALCFVLTALKLVGEYEGRSYFITHGQFIALAGIVMSASALLHETAPGNLYPHLCSFACLLVIAVIDGQTGYVYDCFGIAGVLICGALALTGGIMTGSFLAFGVCSLQLCMSGLYLLVIGLTAALKGLGAGDVPVYLALMLYYMRYAALPEEAAVFMLLLSQLLFGIGALCRRKRYLPLVPYICMAHLVTLCLWTG